MNLNGQTSLIDVFGHVNAHKMNNLSVGHMPITLGVKSLISSGIAHETTQNYLIR
jgi:hypothetical protein